VGFDVCVVIEICWELRSCVGDVEGHFFVIVDCPVCRSGLFDDCFASVVVTSQVCGYCWQVRDLGLLGRHV